MPKIHPTAIVDPQAQIAKSVEIGPMCYVGPHVKLGPGCKLMAQCHVTGRTTMGTNNIIFPFAVIGADAEDVSIENDDTYLEIGHDNIFREGVTINTGNKPGTKTVIGNGCFLMANVHVAHNCIIGNKVILIVGVGLAGFVTVGDGALVSGMSVMHQFCKIGRLAIISAGSAFSKDIPPFMMAEGRNGGVKMINKIGLERAGFTKETIRALRNVHKIYFREGLNGSNALAKIKTDVPQLPEVLEFIEFCETSERGVLQNKIAGRRS
ncbi:MAG: acyl-ACP--UDP-N-acetylglucosamine O-acyltransferase [Victivallaceae bacterium]|nr:acyl-ACP--UDP-N-acetylglucosamine O-acyltransferase [Victivallaceae bacterium]